MLVQIEKSDNKLRESEERYRLLIERMTDGLGLSVSYFIITENHEGDMVVESTPGQGTRFIIWLPLDQVGPSPQPPGGGMNHQD